MLNVVAFRRDNFDGPIEVSAAGLPAGIKARPVMIGPGQQMAQLVFESLADQPTWAGTIEVLGTALIEGQQVARHARSGTALWAENSTKKKLVALTAGRLAHTIALAATADESLPVKIEFGGPDAVEMSRAGKLQLPIKIVRSGFADALTFEVQGLPGSPKKPPTLEIAAGKSEGQLVIDVPAKALVGEYSIVLRAEAKIDYRRDAGGLREAGEFKARVEKLIAEARAKAKSATSEAAKRQAETDVQAALDKAMAAADKRLADATKQAQPKPESVVLYSPPVRLKITVAPVELTLKDPSPAMRPGEIKVPVALLRRYNYAEQVALDATPDVQVPGVKIAPIVIPAGKTEGTLLVTIGPKTPPGTHRLAVRAKVKFNGQTLDTDSTFTISVK